MAETELELETQIITLFKADSGFNTVPAFVAGVAPSPIPIELFPLCEVIVSSSTEETGARETAADEYRYSGTVLFSTQLIDQLVVVARVITIASHAQAVAFAGAAKRLLNSQQDLGSFVSTDGKERVWRVDVSSPRYNIAESRARPNNLENLAQVNFVIYTKRQTW